MLSPSAALAAPSLPLPAMHPASSLSVTSTEGNSELREQQQLVHEAASPPPPRPPGTRAGGDAVGIIRCQDCRVLAKSNCAHRRCCFCCSSRGFVCPAHGSAAGQRNEPQHTLAAAVAPTRRKRPRALHSVASPTTSSSVGQATAAERFAREVSMDAVVFRRVRLGPHHNAEVAYHATVTIGGHVFRGMLYDVGPTRSRPRRSTASTDTAGSSDDESSRSTADGGGLDLTLKL